MQAQEAGGGANTVQTLNATVEINSNIATTAATPGTLMAGREGEEGPQPRTWWADDEPAPEQAPAEQPAPPEQAPAEQPAPPEQAAGIPSTLTEGTTAQ
jgi:hypothetical protein